MNLSIYYVYAGSGKAACRKLDGSKIRPCLASGDGPLEILGQPPVAAKPSEGSLDEPASRQQLKTLVWSDRSTISSVRRPHPASAVSSLSPA